MCAGSVDSQYVNRRPYRPIGLDLGANLVADRLGQSSGSHLLRFLIGSGMGTLTQTEMLYGIVAFWSGTMQLLRLQQMPARVRSIIPVEDDRNAFFKTEKHDLKHVLSRIPFPECLGIFGLHNSDGSPQFRNNVKVEGGRPIMEGCRIVRGATHDRLHAESGIQIFPKLRGCPKSSRLARFIDFANRVGHHVLPVDFSAVRADGDGTGGSEADNRGSKEYTTADE